MKYSLIALTCIIALVYSQSDNIYLSSYRDVQIFQSSDCTSGFHYRIPLNGKCQQIPPWILEDNWSMGVMVPDDMYVRFYADENCAETMDMAITNSIEEPGTSSNCVNGDLGGFGGLKARSLRLITYVIN